MNKDSKKKITDQDIALKYNEKGLIPAVVQDINTKKVLMVAYMNQKSLKRSLEIKETVFYSRSRQKLWHKGETSGNTQKIKDIYYDCDQDTLLVMVDPAGPACHTGHETCFYRKLIEGENLKKDKDSIITELFQLINQRKENLPDESYTSYLFKEGLDKILKKVGEESSEVIIAAKNESKEELIYETVDLIYHLLVLLAEKNLKLEEIKEELENRYNK